MIKLPWKINGGENGNYIGSNFWLSDWSEDYSDQQLANDTDFRNLRLTVYIVLGFGATIVILFTLIFLYLARLKASRLIHGEMLVNIMREPMSFFDTTPIRRILNRFSSDIYILDTMFNMAVRSLLIEFFLVLTSFTVIGIQTPWVLLIQLPLSIVYYFLQKYYISTTRQLQRISSAVNSPIYTHFSEKISCAASIRAYNGFHDTLLSDTSSSDNYLSETFEKVSQTNKCPTNKCLYDIWVTKSAPDTV